MTSRGDFEEKLQQLRSQAAAGPMSRPEQVGALRGYYGRPVIKPPVWTWEVPLYFFVGGVAGGAAVLAGAADIAGYDRDFVRAAAWMAAGGALVAPVLLIMDLGRPHRFLNMLRIFKIESPMSIGAWILAAFGAVTVTAAVSMEIAVPPWIGTSLLLIAIPLGAALATYTGVLIGATVVPVWFTHHRLLPFHFGVVALGGAAALLELVGHRVVPLYIIGLAAAAIETGVGVWLELGPETRINAPLRQGRPGAMMRGAALLTGPVALVARVLGPVGLAAVAFLAGSLLSRYGWMEAGRRSALEPAAVLDG